MGRNCLPSGQKSERFALGTGARNRAHFCV
jgi:hypothetical protein